MTPAMGRPKTVYLDLPPRMGARRLKSGRLLYHYRAGKKKLPLGDDINKARLKWAEYESGQAAAGRFPEIAAAWEASDDFRRLAPRTQELYRMSLVQLGTAFKDFTLEQTRPAHIRQYLSRRSSKVAANREISLYSTIHNWARGEGKTDAPNPCLGIRRNRERPRDRYVTEAEYKAAMTKAPPFLQDAMDLALLTGQRPSDVLRMSRQDVRDGCLWVRQAKTGAKVGIRVEGELEAVLARIVARPRAVPSMILIADERGQRVTYWALNYAFTKLKTGWQFRDLRAKMVTDEADLRTAQQRAGHKSEQTTMRVYRRMKGTVVGPLKREKLGTD